MREKRLIIQHRNSNVKACFPCGSAEQTVLSGEFVSKNTAQHEDNGSVLWFECVRLVTR